MARCTFAELEGQTIRKVKMAEVDEYGDKEAVSELYEFELETGRKLHFKVTSGVGGERFYVVADRYTEAIPPVKGSGPSGAEDSAVLLRPFSEQAPTGE